MGYFPGITHKVGSQRRVLWATPQLRRATHSGNPSGILVGSPDSFYDVDLADVSPSDYTDLMSAAETFQAAYWMGPAFRIDNVRATSDDLITGSVHLRLSEVVNGLTTGASAFIGIIDASYHGFGISLDYPVAGTRRVGVWASTSSSYAKSFETSPNTQSVRSYGETMSLLNRHPGLVGALGVDSSGDASTSQAVSMGATLTDSEVQGPLFWVVAFGKGAVASSANVGVVPQFVIRPPIEGTFAT